MLDSKMREKKEGKLWNEKKKKRRLGAARLRALRWQTPCHDGLDVRREVFRMKK